VAENAKSSNIGVGGKRTRQFIRLSTVAASPRGPNVARDPLGFAMQYYNRGRN